jgi:surfactin synthase thioesterase subunit
MNSSASLQKIVKNNSWIAYRKIQSNAKIRLFCFPYGGGGASIYRDWQRDFSNAIEVCPIQLPGRESRLYDDPILHMDALVEQIVQNIINEFDLPFAFFGHSFGALIAFELARYLRKNNLPQPCHLFASAYPDPRIPSRNLNNLLLRLKAINLDLFKLNADALAILNQDEISKLSAIFKESGIAEYSEERMSINAIKILLPIFVGDMKTIKNYRYRDELPLDLAITIFAGKQDIWVSHEDCLGWKAHTNKHYEVHTFDGGHLFLREGNCKQVMIQKIVELITCQ